MRKRTLAFGLCFLLICFIFIPITFGINVKISTREHPFILGRGKTLYVGGSGPDNYTKIQHAIDDAEDGETVYVYNDSSPYYENVVIDKSINLEGENRDSTIIYGNGIENVVTINANNVTIQELSIQNGGKEWGNAGIFINSDNSTIINNNINKNNKNGIIIFEYVKNNLITQNYIFENGGGIRAYKKSINNIISGNIIENNKGDGIVLLRCIYNIFEDNIIQNNSQNGVYDSLSTGNYFSKNYICSNGHHGLHFFYSTNHTVFKNEILYNSKIGVGINSKGEKNHNISNNIINYNSNGIYVDSSLDTVDKHIIKDNIISNNKNLGFGLYYGGSNYIINNEFSQNKYGIYIPTYSRYNVVSDNVFLNDGIFVGEEANVFSNNTVNGKPLVVLEGKTNMLFEDEAGQIVIINCNKIIVRNLDISNTSIGIIVISSNNCEFKQNKLSDNTGYGIYLTGNKNKIYHNEIYNCERGLSMSSNEGITSYNNVYNNVIRNNDKGIQLYENNKFSGDNHEHYIINFKVSIEGGVKNNRIYSNDILYNKVGLSIGSLNSEGAVYNRIYWNNFIGNTESNARVDSKPGINYWDDLGFGNFWHDYQGKDKDNDGIGDTPYVIRKSRYVTNEDNYPRMEPYGEFYQDAPDAPEINGSTNPKPGVEYGYTFVTTDPNGDDVFYYISWGDDTFDEWIGPYDSGVEVNLNHTWIDKKNYVITAQAKDTNGLVGCWGTLPIIMPRNRATYNSLFTCLFELIPIIKEVILRLIR